MQLPDVHDPHYWVQELRPLLDEIHFAFRVAYPRALDYFDSYRKKPINGPLLSNLIRYDVLEYLKSHGISAHELDEIEDAGPIEGCGINPLPNNGIELIYKSSCIRIRKGVDPPMPTTDSQKGWYQQELGLVFEDGSPAAITNLLVLWYSSDPRTLAGLKLIRTKRVLRTIPLSTPIPPDYSRASDLPLGQSDEQKRTDDLDGTGTDDHQW